MIVVDDTSGPAGGLLLCLVDTGRRSRHGSVRRRVLTRIGLVAALGGTIAAVATLAACSGGSPSGGNASPVGNGSAAPAQLNTCTIYAQQHDAEIIVSPGDKSECDTLISDLSDGGAFWSYTPNGISLANLVQACDVTSSDGTYEAVVLDDSGGFLGQGACSGFVTAGWTTSQQSGPVARNVTAQQQELQQQQASASAAASQGAANQEQEQNAQNDVSTLTQDANFSSDVSSVANDVQSTDNDVATTRSDAANGNGDQCINASTTVYNDAATTVYNDDLTTVYNDVGAVASDISKVRGDIATVQSDQAALQNSGLPATSGAAAAISAAQSAIASAISTVNADIDHANGDLDTAYQIADSVGTAACAGDGPGTPPVGVSHLK
jgi:hypothetical protein